MLERMGTVGSRGPERALLLEAGGGQATLRHWQSAQILIEPVAPILWTRADRCALPQVRSWLISDRQTALFPSRPNLRPLDWEGLVHS